MAKVICSTGEGKLRSAESAAEACTGGRKHKMSETKASKRPMPPTIGKPAATNAADHQRLCPVSRKRRSTAYSCASARVSCASLPWLPFSGKINNR